MATEAFITPEIVRWARERDQLSTEKAAQRLNVKPERLDAWERGTARPTFRQAQTLAQRLNIPFGYLFLSSPPEERLPLPDLRTIGDQPTRQPSPELRDVVDDALEKQNWYREYQEGEGAEPLSFIGRCTLSDLPDTIAHDIRDTLGIDTGLREKSSTWEEFLRRLIAQTELARVLVLRSGIVGSNTHRSLEVEEFRGFAISDDLAPLVFINSRDAKGAQIFTLAHELAHLWIGASGISNPDYHVPASQQNNAVERLSNRTAAEILLPKDEFLASWISSRSAHDNLRALSSRFKVSNMVVLRQALDHHLLTPSHYWELYKELVDSGRRNTKESESGNFYNSFYARNSRTLAAAVIGAVAADRMSYLDASRLLNVRAATLDRVKERLLMAGDVIG